MRIFYAVQVSNTTKTQNGMKFLLKNDACMNIMRGIVMAVLEKKKDWEFVIKVPFLGSVEDIESYHELFPEKFRDRISFYQHQIPVSPVDSRFHFDFDFHRTAFLFNSDLRNIDVMINDENTLLMNWKVLFHNLGIKVPIISTNYFFDSPTAKKTPEGILYFDRQLESFIHSDIAAFQCEATMLETLLEVNKYLKKGSYEITSSVWGVGCSAAEILDKSIEPMNFDEYPVIYFGNRITETAGRYTNWDNFAEAIGKLQGLTAEKYSAVMLDPTRKTSEEQKREINIKSKDKVEFHHFNREAYLRFIHGASISCNLFVNEVHGGVTHAEAMLARNIVIMPKVNNYWLKMKKFAKDYPFFVKHKGFKIDPTNLAKKLDMALTMLKFEPRKAKHWQDICHKAAMACETYESAAPKIISDLSVAARKGGHS